MLTHRNLLMACFAALLALGLAACGTGGNGPGPTTDDEDDQAMMPATPEPTPDPEPTPLAVAQAAAQAAADAAGAAATLAETDAAAAVTAATGRALIQTAANSSTHAYDAHTHAGYARTAADNAQTAATEAADATALIDAIRAQLAAEAFQKSAEDHRGHVTGFHGDAVAAAANEVFVGEDGHKIDATTIVAGAPVNTVIANGQTTITGKLADITRAMVGPVMAQEPNTGATPAELYRQAVAARDVNIGTTTDSADDTARLMLVTAYAGSRMVHVYATETGVDLTGTVVGNRIQTAGFGDDDLTNDVFVTLTAVGMFYTAGAADGAANGLDEDDEVADDATAVQVYSYPDPDNDGETIYVVLESSTTTPGTGATTVLYQRVDITADHDAVTDPAVTPEQRIQARLAEATAYKHMNFGVWAALGEAKADGSQSPAALGVGFVNALATGDGMTGADMPNNGTADYTGDWVGTVQAADADGNGAVTAHWNAATIGADFGKGTVDVTLMGLAALTGTITDNTFSGTKATVAEMPMEGVSLGAGPFTGTFNGGFFGAAAAEAGGVFSFASVGNKDGAFAGAFGGDRDDN